MGTVPTPLDWVANAGAMATAEMLEAGVGDPLTFLLNPPGVQAYRSTAVPIPATTATPIPFTVEDFDNDAGGGASDTMHAVNSTQFVAKWAGRYLVGGQIPYDAATSGVRECRLTKNGATLIPGGRVIQPATAAAVSCVLPPIEVSMNLNDYLELAAFSATAVNTTAANGLFPIFRMRWVGP